MAGQFIGAIIKHRREDIVFQEGPQRHVLFLYSGVVGFVFGGGDSNLRTETLHVDIPDSAFTNSQIKAPNGIAAMITPTNFNSNGGALSLAVTNPEVQFSAAGAGLTLSADISAANATLFEVAYQFSVNAVL
jgi:hypothetical protein